MKLQNIKNHVARFPEIKPLIKGVNPENLVIHVEPMDKNALYREVAWASGTAIYDKNRPNQAGLITERAYRTVREADGHKLEIPNDGKPPRHLAGFFLRHLARVEEPCKRVIVWQQIVWYETQEGQRPLESGRKFDTEVRIDVYLPPKTGVTRLFQETDVSKNVRLSPQMLDSILIEVGMGTHKAGNLPDAENMENAAKRLRSIAKAFQFGAYFRGLRETMEVSCSRECEGKIGDYAIRTAIENSRLRVVLERGNVSVEFTGSRTCDDPNFTISNAGFTLDEADTLTSGFVKAWKELYWPNPQPGMLEILLPVDNAPMA